MDRVGGQRGGVALRVSEVSFGYTRAQKALDQVSFAVPVGGFTALLGPNGAGKSTLMGLVTRLFSPETGTIQVCGHDLRTSPRGALSAMGVVFQRPTLDLDLTVEQNLRYAATLYGLSRAEMRERSRDVLQRLDLLDRGRSTVRTLSGGMRRRVEIARALLHRPQLLILDEPTVGLDIDSRRDIVEHAHRLCREENLAILWATHLIDEIKPDDGVVLLHRGRVRAAGPIDQLLLTAKASTLQDAYQRLTAPLAA
jgi:ABC-2 type transport system ATP-binding protein